MGQRVKIYTILYFFRAYVVQNNFHSKMSYDGNLIRYTLLWTKLRVFDHSTRSWIVEIEYHISVWLKFHTLAM